MRRVPSLGEAAIAKVVHGPEAFTPDGEFLLGETAVRGLWAAAGFCVHGLAAAGGVGKVMAEWIVDGSPEYDVFGMDLRRFGGHARSASWARAKALDSYSKYYDIVYPGEERTAARPLRRSPAWVRHAELGAAFGEKAGLGAGQLVRVQRGRRSEATRGASGGVGGQDLVLGDPAGVPGHAGRGGTVRPDVVLEAGGVGTRGPDGVAAGVRRAARQARRLDRLHPAPERARRHRGRPDRHPPGRGPIPPGHRHRLRRPRRRLAPRPRPRRPGRHLGPRLLLPLGAARRCDILGSVSADDLTFGYMGPGRSASETSPCWPSG